MSVNLNANGTIVSSSNPMPTNNPQDVLVAGFTATGGEVHDGDTGAPRLVRPTDVSPDFRTRIGTDSLLWRDTFNHAQFNVSKYIGVESTMTKAIAGGKLSLNAGNSLASGAVARVQTFRTFPLFLSYALYVDMELDFSQTPVTNNVCEFGLGLASGITTPTDGAFFRLNGAGQLQGVINNNGAETVTNLPGVAIVSGLVYHALIVIANDRTEFWFDDEMLGVILTPSAIGSPCMSGSLPLLLREYNSAATSTAQRMEFAVISVTLADMESNKLWSTTMAGMGQSSINLPDGVAPGQSANNVNSTVPASATLSNTAAGYATLGGQFQFAAVAGAETDYALFAYQVPVATAAIPGKTLVISGVHIEVFNMGAASATTPTLFQWSLGVGSTAVSLATVDSATAGTRAPRRLLLGVQSIPVAAAIGQNVTPVDINLDAPVVCEAGTFVHIILKMPVGTATASQIIRGTVTVNGYWE